MPNPIPPSVPARCHRAYMALRGDYGMPLAVSRRGGWWHHDDVTKATGHADDARKLRLLHESTSGLVERRDWPREDGRKPDLAVFRLVAGAQQGELFHVQEARP